MNDYIQKPNKLASETIKRILETKDFSLYCELETMIKHMNDALKTLLINFTRVKYVFYQDENKEFRELVKKDFFEHYDLLIHNIKIKPYLEKYFSSELYLDKYLERLEDLRTNLLKKPRTEK